MPTKKVTISDHVLIPKHEKLNDSEKKAVLELYGITEKELPLISVSDPALAEMKVKTGDVIKIERNSPTAGVSIFYRSVV